MITPFLLVSVLFAQEVPTVGANSRQKFAFEWPALDAGGNPAAATEVRFRLLRVNVDPPAPFAYGVSIPLVMSEAGTYQVPVKDVFKDREAGDWEVTLRVMNAAGNYSEYSDPPLLIRLVTDAPAAATNLRIDPETP